VRIGPYDKIYFEDLKFSSIAVSAEFSTSPSRKFKKSASEITRFAVFSMRFHVSPT